MARGFSQIQRVSLIEGEFAHAASGRHYQVVRRGGSVLQRRFELNPKGDEANVFEMEVTHVVGSGNHARTLLHRSEAGEFTELPLTWYSQEQRWAMSPGFDNTAPPDFTRIVDDRCLFCHNGYPDANGTLAEGIDCQRCHGPGASHVALAAAGNAKPAEIQAAIVNPGKLNPERKLDVCMQCHLETTSLELPSMIRRFDRSVNSFLPGEALGSYAVQFEVADPAARRFEIVNQAYRLRQSACFLKSQGKLSCISCHNPHEHESSKAEFRSKCMSCHPAVNAAGHPDLQNADCMGCHMVKRRAEDAVHVIMTDHFIQRKPPLRDAAKMLVEASDAASGRPEVYYPPHLSDAERDLYLGVALISGGRSPHDGIAMIERRLQAETAPKAVAVLGEGYLAEGNPAKAIEILRQSLTKDPNQPKVSYNLGEALAAAGRNAEARVEYEQALRLRAIFPEAEYALANILRKLGDQA
ncbi:MAG: tetratricopeptide repeat protein, partial [Bryobacteraceae bacterium]